MLNSKTNVFLTSGIYHVAVKQCGFGALRGNLLKQESVCLSERAGRGAWEGPTCRGNPMPGWFFTLYLRRWSIPLVPRCSSVHTRSSRQSLEKLLLPTAWLGLSTRTGSSVLPQHTFAFHRSGRLRDHPTLGV